jgi:hypothetical protein
MFTCMYIGRYTHRESQQQWVMAEPVLLSTAAQQEPRPQDRGLVGFGCFWYRSFTGTCWNILSGSQSLLPRAPWVCQWTRRFSGRNCVVVVMRPNETLVFSSILKSLWPQRVAKRSSRNLSVSWQAALQRAKGRFLRLSVLYLGDIFMSRRFFPEQVPQWRLQQWYQELG